MFKSKLAELRPRLMYALHQMVQGYLHQAYSDNEYNDKVKTVDGFTDMLKDDNYLYWLSEETMTMDKNNPTVVDFEADLNDLLRALGDGDKFEHFRDMIMDEIMHSEQLPLAFPDMLMYVGTLAIQDTGDTLTLKDAVLRIHDATEYWAVNKKTSKYEKVVVLSLYHKIPLNGGGEEYVTVATPVELIRLKSGQRTIQRADWDERRMKSAFGGIDMVDAQRWDTQYKTLMTYLFGAFQFLYRHQKIEYTEVEAPEGLNKKRRKKGKEPYTSYRVSRLGDFTKPVYQTESKPSEDPVRGVAMHVRRGHWRLKWGHRKLPVEQQEKVWLEATVAGDPRYGIIVRDYSSDLLNAEAKEEIEETA